MEERGARLDVAHVGEGDGEDALGGGSAGLQRHRRAVELVFELEAGLLRGALRLGEEDSASACPTRASAAEQRVLQLRPDGRRNSWPRRG